MGFSKHSNSLVSSDDNVIDLSSDISIAENESLSSKCLSDMTTNKVTDFSDSEEFNEEWNALEHHISDITNDFIQDKYCLITGVVTEVVSDNQIMIDGKQIIYQRNYITDLSVDDLVNVVVGSDDKVTVKPLRYKLMTGKITEYQKEFTRFVFCDQKAFIRKTSSTQSLSVGDLQKCVVIETQNSDFKWRAYPYEESSDPSVNKVDHIDSYTEELLSKKYGIEIDKEISFGEMGLNRKKFVFVLIQNKGTEPQTLVSVESVEGETQISFSSFYGRRREPPHVIRSGDYAYVELICKTQYLGEHNSLLEFKFESFKIGRFVSLSVRNFYTDNQWIAYNSGQTPYKSTDRIFYGCGQQIVIIRGEKPWNPNKMICETMKKYNLPLPLRRAVERRSSIKSLPELERPFNKFNYRKRFHALLYLEECENQLILNRYNMSGVRLRTEGRYITITVPGLADGRPSLKIGDRILVFKENKLKEEKAIGFEGYIQEVKTQDILIRFNREFHTNFRDGSFHVKFTLSRTVIRRCHHAVDMAPHMVEEVLFPNKLLFKTPLKRIPINSVDWINNSLNERQKMAVVGALRGECRPTPYIIFGPPGTGKTVTIVESILQVFKNLSKSRVIVCTAANCSADLVAQKLLDSGLVTNQELIRIKGFNRQTPEELESITQIANEDPKEWLYHRIIVTTTSQAGIIFRHKLSSNHFTHAFIDEAAQVTEPESLIPIVMSAMGYGVVVLAGDHQQLGPVIFSRKAKDYGLHVSLMERLINSFKPYKKDEKFKKYSYFNPKFLVKLIDNYRTDKHIMRIPSKLFYENEIKFNFKTDHKLINDLKLNSGVNFVGVKGKDQKGKDIPSWYNLDEVKMVYRILIELYNSGVDPKEIGIITPYRKQVMEIRDYINDMDLVECRVGTIEEFQGLEKRVIILSMVRSAKKYLQYDRNYNLGFVHNPKRLNVAISRAMSVLFVIGNPCLLSIDKNWHKFIEYCRQKKSYSISEE